MTTTTDNPSDHPGGAGRAGRERLRPTGIVPAAALLAALGSLAYISTVLVGGGLTAREAFLLPIGVVGSGLAALGCIGLALRIPAELTGPAWARWTTAAACAFVMTQAWASATVVVGLAGRVDDATFDAVGTSWGLAALMMPKIPLALLGLGGLAVSGWRSRSMPRGAALLLALAALASVLPPFPPGLLLAALGLGWAARSNRA